MTLPIWAPAPSGRPASGWAFLRGRFTVADRARPVTATLRVSASSPEPARQFVATVWVNGTFVGLAPTRPVANETRSLVLNITHLLSRKTNVVAAVAHAMQDQRFWADVELVYHDGSIDHAGTGPAWRTLDGGLAYPAAGSIGTSYFVAPVENLDSRQFPHGFTSSSFDDSAWAEPVIKEPFAELVPAPTAPVTRQLPRPVSVAQVDGVYRLDYGRTWVGGMSLPARGPAGSVWEIRYGQTRSSDGGVVFDTAAGNRYVDRWTLDGAARRLETWGLRVFRHVDIIGAPPGLGPDELTALAYVYPFDRTEANFTCDDEQLNAIWRLSRDTIEATNLDLYVDSWERERCPYEADAYLQLRSHLAVSSDVRLGRYSIDYLLQRRTWPTEWPLYLILAERELYLHTGNLDALAQRYQALIARLPSQWLDPATGLVRKTTGSDGDHSHNDFDLVDWPAAERDNFVFGPVNTVVNALTHGSYQAMAELAAALRFPDQAAEFHAVSDRLSAAINDRLWDDHTGAYADGLDAPGARLSHCSVHASLFPLAFDVVPPDRVDRVIDYLASRGMACSVYAAAFEITALFQHRRPEVALGLLTSDDVRSFTSMINAGAGATMEAWHHTLKPNTTYSHPWSSWPAYLLPFGIFGVRPTTPGWHTVEIRPQPGPLHRAATTFPTPQGPIRLALEAHDTATLVNVELPAGVEADLYGPGPDATHHRIGAGSHQITVLAPRPPEDVTSALE